MSRSLGILIAALFAGALPSCSTQCDRHPDEPPVVFGDGFTDQAAHVYWSSPNAENPWDGPWLDFPAGRTYRFVHHLGGLPGDVTYWFSFSPHPLSDKSGFTQGAGNQGTVQAIDSDHVDIRNDTCSDVFIFVRIADPRLESTDAGTGSDAAP